MRSRPAGAPGDKAFVTESLGCVPAPCDSSVGVISNYNQRMKLLVAILLVTLLLPGCYYPTTPVATGPTLQQRFEQSWSAAMGAMADQGLSIHEENRGAGVIRGSRNGVVITATLFTRDDGRLQVEFTQSGETSNDPDLNSRVAESYNRRMGR